MMNSCVSWLLLNRMPNNANSTCMKAGENLRQLALHAIIVVCRTKWLGSHFLTHWRTHTHSSCQKLNPVPFFWLEYPNPYHTFLYYRSIHCLNTLLVNARLIFICWKTACFFTLLSHTQHLYIAELCSILTYCWGIPYPFTLLSNSEFWNIAELYTILKHFWVIPYFIALLISSQFRNIADLHSILTHCWVILNINTLLGFTLS